MESDVSCKLKEVKGVALRSLLFSSGEYELRRDLVNVLTVLDPELAAHYVNGTIPEDVKRELSLF